MPGDAGCSYDAAVSADAPLLAAASSIVYGTADFAGGLASKKNDGLIVTFVSQCLGVVALAIAMIVWPEGTARWSDIGWGVCGGAAGGLGLSFFYPALAAGPMSVVAPVTALCSAALPLVVGVGLGDRPGALAWMGLVVALPAIGLVARERNDEHRSAARSTLVSSLIAGTGFGLFFVFLSAAENGSGLWPLVGSRVGSLSFVGGMIVLRRRTFRISKGSWPAISVAGVGDIGANALYLVALSRGLLSIVAVIGSMYPASTVVLARIWLGERMARAQIIGLLLAAVALALVAIGR